MESIKVQYTDPELGTEKFDIVKFDISKYRKDDSDSPSENIFFTSGVGSTIATMREIVDLAEAALVANPANPYGCTTTIYGIVASKPNGGATELTLTQNPQTLGFQTGDFVAILSSFSDTTSVEVKEITNVTSTKIEFGSAVDGSIKGNYVVVKMEIPTPFVTSFTTESADWGAKALLERPNPPSIDGTPGAGSIDVTLTKPATKKIVTKKWLVYVISASAETTFDPILPVIKANRKPDLTLDYPVGNTATGTATTYGGGANFGGGTITNGTYYICAVAKDGTSDKDVNISGLSNIDTVVVSY